MIFARPGQSFTALLEDAPAGLAGTLTVAIETPTGGVVDAAASTGIVEVYTGDYTATRTAPTTAGSYVVVWRNGTETIREELTVSGALTSILSPSGPTAGISFGELVAAYQEMTSVTAARAKARINQAYRRFARRSEAIKAKVALGSTVIGQSAYDLDAAIIGLYNLRVDGKRYDRKSPDEIDDLNASDAYIRGYANGFFAPEYSSDGGGQFLLYPAPTVAGLAVTGRVSLYPADMVDDAEYPLLPAGYHDSLTDGAFAIGLGRDDERFADRQALLAEFDAQAAECRGDMRRRVGSGGVHRIKLSR